MYSDTLMFGMFTFAAIPCATTGFVTPDLVGRVWAAW
jgi:hypothetical protein